MLLLEASATTISLSSKRILEKNYLVWRKERYLRAAAAWRQLAERKLVLDSALLPGDIATAEELSKNAALPA